MIHGQFLQPDHDKGDANTIGGYMAVHDRPAAFEGPDGFSYSVELLTEQADPAESRHAWAAFFLFVRWTRVGTQTPEGHLETEYIAFGDSEEQARRAGGALKLADVRAMLDALVTEGVDATPPRRWWDAMRDDTGDDEGGSHA